MCVRQLRTLGVDRACSFVFFCTFFIPRAIYVPHAKDEENYAGERKNRPRAKLGKHAREHSSYEQQIGTREDHFVFDRECQNKTQAEPNDGLPTRRTIDSLVKVLNLLVRVLINVLNRDVFTSVILVLRPQLHLQQNRRNESMDRIAKFAPLIAGIALFLSACGGGADEPATAGVASATDLDEAVASAEELADDIVEDDAADTGEVTAEEAALAFSQCMRDNGFDSFPDPEIGQNGAPNLRGAFQDADIDVQSEEFQTTATTCRDEAGADNFGAGARGGDARADIQENLLAYTQCLRDEGLDVGDLGGGGGPGAGNGGNGAGNGNGGQGNGDGNGGAGAGRAQGNGGAGVDRTARIAQVLGVDIEEPSVAAAFDACEPVFEEAVGGAFGGGGRGAAPANDPA